MSNELTLQSLLEAGAHFGHQTHKWNPKMKQYIFGERNGIYIVDLAKTIPLAKKAYDFMKKVSSEGKPILFVGTKRQASETVKMAAKDCGAYHITHRWLGGMLTNFKTIALSIDKLRKVEKMKETGDFELLTKKERSKIDKDVIKLERNLGGIKDMRKLPRGSYQFAVNNEYNMSMHCWHNKNPVHVLSTADSTAIEEVSRKQGSNKIIVQCPGIIKNYN